jgi:hypothetical protein
MAGLFDFEHYYKEKTIKTDIKLDVSDIPLKATPSSLATNDDGSIDDVNMNELVTNNVMYRITRLITGNAGELSANDRLIIYYTDESGITTPVYTALGYPLDDLVADGLFTLPESRAAIMPFTLSVGMKIEGDKELTITGMTRCSGNQNDDEGTQLNAIEVHVTPRFRWMNSSAQFDYDPTTADNTYLNQNFWAQVVPEQSAYTSYALAATGLVGGELYKGFKWLAKQGNGKASAVYKYDYFMKMINGIGKVAKENNLGIKTVFFDDSYADPTEWTDGMSAKEYNRLRIEHDWTRTDISSKAKMRDVYTSSDDCAINQFALKCWSREDNPLPYIAEDKVTALIPNVTDVFKKLYTPAADLAEEFSDKYIDTYNEIMSIRGVQKFMPSSLKTKLRNNQYMLKKVATIKSYALDMASFVNFLNAMFHYNSSGVYQPTLSYGLYEKHTTPIEWTSGVRLFSTKGFETVYALGTHNKDANGKVITQPPTYIAVTHRDYSQIIASDEKSTGMLHAMMGNPLYSDWEMKVQKEVSVREVKKQIAEIYSGVYNSYYELSEGDPGYISCTYEPKKDDPNTYIFRVYSYDNTGRPFDMNVNPGYAPGEAQSMVIWTPSLLTMHSNLADMTYCGSVAQFADICLVMISSLYERVTNISIPDSQTFQGIPNRCIYCKAGYPVFSDEAKVPAIIEWDSSSTPGDVISERAFEPAYEILENVGDASNYTINDCIDFVDTMDEAIDSIDDILTAQGLVLGPSFLLVQKLRLRTAKGYYSDLEDVINRIKWYQTFTNESVFDNKTFIGDRLDYSYATCPYIFMPARFLLPVQMYKRVRVKYKRFGRTRHKTVKRSIGVRWCEVTFVDNDVYEAYPPNSAEPRQFYPIGKTARSLPGTGGLTYFTFDQPIEGDAADQIDVGAVTAFDHGDIVLASADGPEISVSIKNASRFVSTEPLTGLGQTVYVVGIYVPLEKTEKSDNRTKIRLEYNMPYIPYDSELRRWAFMNYGAFDQDKYASETREMPADPDTKVPGWVIFKNSSKRIGDMRASMGIYDAVAILMGILRNTYGASMVELVETMRSKDDQELMSSGGGESTFLSWHNYGLAVKILINDKSTGLPIEDGSPEFKQLIDIAEGFTTACQNGVFGKPLNVVWCGRLKIGANIFVWEFLPIGVNHKDAMKFREATLNQEDPVASLGFVNVDAEKLVYSSKPKEKVPYILKNSSAYQNAVLINGQHYVSPKNIRNYTVPHDIVLTNVIEFCNLIRTKMQANGSSLNSRANIYEWKALNDKSYKQLLIYYGLTGSLTAARALVSGEYVETYKDIVDRKYTEDMVEMVKDYLGNLYQDAKIFVEEAADGGAWLTLSDGKLHIKTTDIRPTFNQNSKDDFYGEKLAPIECTERGLYIDGVFKTEAELEAMGYPIETVSDKSFIDGFKDGKPVGDDALFLHTLVATQIKEEFDALKDLFENYGGGIMYDHFVDGPNASMADMVENEFGLIDGQDLLGFDELRAIFNQKNIDDNASKYSDGTIKGAGGVNGDDVFEKVVSNAELAGVRKASLTKEHITVTVQPSNMSTEELYKVIMKGAMTQANDMFKK